MAMIVIMIGNFLDLESSFIKFSAHHIFAIHLMNIRETHPGWYTKKCFCYIIILSLSNHSSLYASSSSYFKG